MVIVILEIIQHYFMLRLNVTHILPSDFVKWAGIALRRGSHSSCFNTWKNDRWQRFASERQYVQSVHCYNWQGHAMALHVIWDGRYIYANPRQRDHVKICRLAMHFSFWSDRLGFYPMTTASFAGNSQKVRNRWMVKPFKEKFFP
jgi:hypothetical protein